MPLQPSPIGKHSPSKDPFLLSPKELPSPGKKVSPRAVKSADQVHVHSALSVRLEESERLLLQLDETRAAEQGTVVIAVWVVVLVYDLYFHVIYLCVIRLGFPNHNLIITLSELLSYLTLPLSNDVTLLLTNAVT